MKAGQKLFNFFWIVFVGIWTAIYSFVLGVVCCITVIGIPLGQQYFKYIKLAFAPAGKVVLLHYGKHPVLNTLWLIFGGLLGFVVYTLLALVLSITVIGLPLAKQLYKIATFNLAPFGCEIINEGEYTKNCDTSYDAALIKTRLLSNPNQPIREIDEQGRLLTTAKAYMVSKKQTMFNSFEKSKRLNRKTKLLYLIPAGVFSLFLLLSDLDIPMSSKVSNGIFGTGIALSALGFLTVYVVRYAIVYFTPEKALNKCLLPLAKYYPLGSVEDKKWSKPALTAKQVLQELQILPPEQNGGKPKA